MIETTDQIDVTLDSRTSDLDPELREVFVAEAEDIFGKIEACIKSLAIDTSDAGSILEMRRYAHTFKGSAAMVGLSDPSKIAHRMEDQIDVFANCPSELRFPELASIANTFEHLRRSTLDALQISADAEPPDFGGDPFAASALAGGTSSNERLKVDGAKNAPETIAEKKTPQPKNTITRVKNSVLDEIETALLKAELSRRSIAVRANELGTEADRLVSAVRRSSEGSRKLLAAIESLQSTLENSGTTLKLNETISDLTRRLVEASEDLRSADQSVQGIFNSISDLGVYQANEFEKLERFLNSVRNIEFGSLRPRIERCARVAAEEFGQRIEIRIHGETELIGSELAEILTEPIMHLIRNSVVHGIEDPDMRRFLGKSETGIIYVGYQRSNTSVMISIRDDGSGIDTEKLKAKAIENGIVSSEKCQMLSKQEVLELIYEPGLTTAQTLSMSAGRGIGMNIIRTGIEALGGTLKVNSIAKVGTEFIIKLPVVQTKLDAIVTEAGGKLLGFPLCFLQDSRTQGNLSDLDRASSIDLRAQDGNSISKLPNDSDFLRLAAGGGTVTVIVDKILGCQTVLYLRNPKADNDAQTPTVGIGSIDLEREIEIIDVEMSVELVRSGDRAGVGLSVGARKESGYILIVDDSPSTRLSHRKIVEKSGIAIKLAENGRIALELMERLSVSPRLIISDIEMPEMNGFQFAEALRNSDRFHSTPMIMISSRWDDEVRAKQNELQIANVLRKPVSENELLKDVARIVGSVR